MSATLNCSVAYLLFQYRLFNYLLNFQLRFIFFAILWSRKVLKAVFLIKRVHQEFLFGELSFNLRFCGHLLDILCKSLPLIFFFLIVFFCYLGLIFYLAEIGPVPEIFFLFILILGVKILCPHLFY